MISIVFFTSSAPVTFQNIPKDYTYGDMFEDAAKIGAVGADIVVGPMTEDLTKLEEVSHD